jgi:lactoylglutathione lyase
MTLDLASVRALLKANKNGPYMRAGASRPSVGQDSCARISDIAKAGSHLRAVVPAAVSAQFFSAAASRRASSQAWGGAANLQVRQTAQRSGPKSSRKAFDMRYLHTMVRVSDLDAALDFYCAQLGLKEVRRQENTTGRFTLVFLATPEDAAKLSGERTSALSPMVELTYNWDEKNYSGGRNFGHLAYAVSDIYVLCARLMAAGTTINRPPRDGHMAFIRSPDGISIELLQQGDALPPQEPWLSMLNMGVW